MILTIFPCRDLPGKPETTILVSGDLLTVDGTPYDLSPIPEGGQATAHGDHPFTGPIRRIGGVLHAPVRAMLGDDADLNQPECWVIEVGDGPVKMPFLRREKPPAHRKSEEAKG